MGPQGALPEAGRYDLADLLLRFSEAQIQCLHFHKNRIARLRRLLILQTNIASKPKKPLQLSAPFNVRPRLDDVELAAIIDH